MKPDSKVWNWRAYIIHYAPDIPPNRHILLILSCFMDSSGGSCFPSVKTLVEATSLSKPTVVKYLNAAAKDGWIKKSIHGYSGQGWRRNEYTATIPIEVVNSISPTTSPNNSSSEQISISESDYSFEEFWDAYDKKVRGEYAE